MFDLEWVESVDNATSKDGYSTRRGEAVQECCLPISMMTLRGGLLGWRRHVWIDVSGSERVSKTLHVRYIR